MLNHSYIALDCRPILARCCLSLTLAAFWALSTLAGPTNSAAATPEEQAEAILLPFLDLLTSPPAGDARACRLLCRVESLSETRFPEGQWPNLEFALQPPGKLLVKLSSSHTDFAACRDGQKAWVAPGDIVPPREAGSPSEKMFPPMQLPFSGKQLAILPVLLEVLDKGTATLESTVCRVLDVRTRPEVSRLLPPEAASWSVRLWVSPEGKPLRAGVRLPNHSLVVRIDRMDFTRELPPTLWTQPKDGRLLSPGDFEKATTQLLQAAR
jgi:hypothetical protein